MLALYNAALWPLRGAAEVWSVWRGRGARAAEWSERLARRMPDVPARGIWLHGASVGEAQVVGALVAALRARDPERVLLVSAQTASGRLRLPAPPLADAAFFAPLDFPGLNARLFAALRPAALVVVETELWPNRLREAERAGVPVVLLNARLAPERMPTYRRFRALFRPRLERLAAIGAQSPPDAERFRALGAREERVAVTGNVKFDLPAPAVDRRRLREELRLGPQRIVLVAGSTRPGEEPEVLAAFRDVRAREAAPMTLIIAPRHPARADEVEAAIRECGLVAARLSDPAPAPDPDVLLVDVLGRLTELYAIASAAFVGGTLAPFGGHNVLEPAAFGVPVAFGPHTGHVAEPAAALERAGAGATVSDAATLAAAWSRWLGDRRARERAGDAAAAVLAAHRGAVERNVELLRATLAASRQAPR